MCQIRVHVYVCISLPACVLAILDGKICEVKNREEREREREREKSRPPNWDLMWTITRSFMKVFFVINCL